METKELLRELVKESINDDFVRDCIRARVNELFSFNIEAEIRNAAEQFVENKASGYIEEEVKTALNNNVRLDDGWGNCKEYGTFEEFVRKKIHEEINKTWKLEEKIRKVTLDKLGKYVKKVVDKRKEEKVDEVLQLIADDIKENGNK